MNRKHLLGAVAVLAAWAAAGPAAGEARLGPMAIASWSNLPQEHTGLIRYDTDRRAGWGARLEVALGRHTALLLEPSLLEKGARGEAEEDGLILTSTVRLRYYELPVLVRYNFELGPVRPYLTAGASLGYLRSATVRTALEGGSEREDVTADLRRTDLGLAIGLGAWVPVGPARCFAEGRFVQGLTNLDRSGETTVHNQSLAVVAGVVFPLGGR